VRTWAVDEIEVASSLNYSILSTIYRMRANAWISLAVGLLDFVEAFHFAAAYVGFRQNFRFIEVYFVAEVGFLLMIHK